mmetsp:Transcript_83672/g.270515  ORF Transcript_83672/g.270515 Transcript_83672/m.270515 type:complete len:251 (+) Transcript_83672:1137-1889(+)|eukprot:CAMPEP_0203882758 /NCGR_PEP_ID=MMETSP0359-20131031/26922_1 /ASSEMBLY_ACC=CAM_ASM_000338 /TAXON_ID=268821 /ORGANISM="Scrippsiella Hangoei, Strain SHTV-5" /LENGTH=250 /DNA_ID=CAMNT_0050802843 /DNA_START=480 /DNA_END=1232 /DNA_ORIENTATION=-
MTASYFNTCVNQLFGRRRSYTWLEYCWARPDDPDMLLESAWARNRKSVIERRLKIADGSDPYRDDLASMLARLTLNERQRVEMYRNLVPGECGDLGQTPDTHAMFSRDGELGTVIKNVGILWNPCLTPERWITRKEFLSAMGFPITAEIVATNQGIGCSFSNGRAVPPSRSRRSEGQFCGNAFHLNAVGAVAFCLLLVLDDFGSQSEVADSRESGNHILRGQKRDLQSNSSSARFATALARKPSSRRKTS